MYNIIIIFADFKFNAKDLLNMYKKAVLCMLKIHLN